MGANHNICAFGYRVRRIASALRPRGRFLANPFLAPGELPPPGVLHFDRGACLWPKAAPDRFVKPVHLRRSRRPQRSGPLNVSGGVCLSRIPELRRATDLVPSASWTATTTMLKRSLSALPASDKARPLHSEPRGPARIVHPLMPGMRRGGNERNGKSGIGQRGLARSSRLLTYV